LTNPRLPLYSYRNMVQSMTGFGSAEHNGSRVEVRSLNHKFLDVNIKAPSFLNQSDITFRNIIRENFSRGKFDVSIVVPFESSTELHINTGLVRQLTETFRKLQEDLDVPGTIDINTIINLHETYVETRQNIDLDTVADLFRRAVADLRAMRLREGAALSAEMLRMTDALSGMKEKVAGLCGRALASAHEKFGERLRTLLEGKEVDSSRLLQEAAVMAAKMDIAEELARLGSHMSQFTGTLQQGGIIGRKLDFILQECNREVNTIASKTVDYEISGITVDMKTLIEQLREQVQNIQ